MDPQATEFSESEGEQPPYVRPPFPQLPPDSWERVRRRQQELDAYEAAHPEIFRAYCHILFEALLDMAAEHTAQHKEEVIQSRAVRPGRATRLRDSSSSDLADIPASLGRSTDKQGRRKKKLG